MQLDYFAGAIFTTQEVVLYCIIGFLVIGTVLGLMVFLVRKFFGQRQSKKPKLATSLLIGFAVIVAIILIFFVTPIRIKDAKWERKQASCAEQVGYRSPADDNSDAATAESQSAYRQCLGLF